MSQPKRILHIEFNLTDLNSWMEGKTHEEIGRIITAIGIASQADDEPYLEQFAFIDRIIFADGTAKKLIRATGPLDMSGIDRPIDKNAMPEVKTSVKRGSSSRKSLQS